MKKLAPLFLFLLTPILAFADGGVEAVAIFGTIILILIIAGLIALGVAITYLVKGKKWTFTLSVILNSLVFAAGVLIYIPTQGSGFDIGELIILGSMVIFVCLFLKRASKKANKPQD